MKFKPKSITEKLFNKENVFSWIESLEEADFAIDKMVEMCDEYNVCSSCQFYIERQFHHCPIYPSNYIQRILKMLYKIVEKNKWEDDDV